MGAIPSKKIAGFLSWVDMWPSPVLKYGELISLVLKRHDKVF